MTTATAHLSDARSHIEAAREVIESGDARFGTFLISEAHDEITIAEWLMAEAVAA